MYAGLYAGPSKHQVPGCTGGDECLTTENLDWYATLCYKEAEGPVKQFNKAIIMISHFEEAS